MAARARRSPEARHLPLARDRRGVHARATCVLGHLRKLSSTPRAAAGRRAHRATGVADSFSLSLAQVDRDAAGAAAGGALVVRRCPRRARLRGARGDLARARRRDRRAILLEAAAAPDATAAAAPWPPSVASRRPPCCRPRRRRRCPRGGPRSGRSHRLAAAAAVVAVTTAAPAALRRLASRASGANGAAQPAAAVHPLLLPPPAAAAVVGGGRQRRRGVGQDASVEEAVDVAWTKLKAFSSSDPQAPGVNPQVLLHSFEVARAARRRVPSPPAAGRSSIGTSMRPTTTWRPAAAADPSACRCAHAPLLSAWPAPAAAAKAASKPAAEEAALVAELQLRVSARSLKVHFASRGAISIR